MSSPALQPAETMQTGIRRAVIIAAIFAVPIVFSTSLGPVRDPDIWWHLRTGEWIVQHHAVPMTDPFSAHAAGQPWIAYSWLFEVVLYALHRILGLMGIVVFQVAVLVGITAALCTAIAHRARNFLAAAALTATTLVTLLPAMTPRPWLFSILLLIIELELIFRTRADGHKWRLLWLIPVFALWANLHIQFIYGLFVCVLAAAEPAINVLLRRVGAMKNANRVATPGWGLLLACGLATLISPYSWHSYQVIFQYASQTGAYDLVSEFHALLFREFPDYAILLLTLGAFFALGWRRETSSFKLLLLLSTAVVAFRSSRDAWFVCIPAALLIAPGASPAAERYLMRWSQRAFTAAAVVFVFAVTLSVRHISNKALDLAVGDSFPDKAAAFITANHIQGPLFNHFDWGGYLIWRLPEMPVTVDGRTNIYGDDFLQRSVATWNAENGWQSDPLLASAHLVIGSKSSPLSTALRSDQRFRLVYEDRIAVVFVSQAN